MNFKVYCNENGELLFLMPLLVEFAVMTLKTVSVTPKLFLYCLAIRISTVTNLFTNLPGLKMRLS